MSKEMFISSSPHETKVAVLEDDQLVEVYFERDTDVGLVSSIYKGRVSRVLPGMQSAFVDIGLERDAFLYVSDFFFEDQEEYDKVFEEAEARALKVVTVEAPAARTEVPPPPVPEVAPVAPEVSEAVAAPPSSDVPAAEAPPSETPGAAPATPSEHHEYRRFEHQRGRPRRRRGRGFNERRYDERKFRPRQETIEESHTFEILPGESLAKYGHVQPREESKETTEEVLAEAHETTGTETPGSGVTEEFAGPVSSVAESEIPGVGSEEAATAFAGAGSLGSSDASKIRVEGHGPESRPELLGAAEQPSPEAPPLVAPSLPGSGSVPPAAGAEIPAVAWEGRKEAFTAPSFTPAQAEGSATTPAAESVAPQATTVRHAEEERGSAVTSFERAGVPENLSTPRETEVDPYAGREVEPSEDVKAELAEDEIGSVEETGNGASPVVEAAGAEEKTAEGASAEAEFSSGAKPEPADQPNSQPAAPAGEAPATTAPTDERKYTLREPHQRPRFAPRRHRGRRGMGRHPRGERRESRPGNHQPMQISELLKEGQEILVQIAKEPLGTKGARITSHIALPGRYLVYMPTIEHIGVSRKIASEEERLRLRNVILENKGSLTGGFIVRTAGQGRSEDEFKADLKFLATLWNEIRGKSERMKAPALLHRDLDLVQRLLRDTLTPDFKTVRVDNESDYERVLDFVSRCQPSLVGKVKLYTRDAPMFEEFGIHQEIEKGLKPKVWLKSGGYIVINQTEALVAIDVNTGKYVGKTNRLEDTIVKTNVDAVHEIVRQIRLRDLGGIIVIDFIDMDERKNRQKVVQALEEALRSDRAPTKVISFHDFGLVAITRKRVKQSLERTLCQPCDYCSGAGWIKSVPTVCYEILAEVRKMAKGIEGDALTLRVNPEVAKALKSREGRLVAELESLTKKDIIIKSDPAVHQERFEIF